MKQIYAWIRDPANNIFKGQTKRSALFRLFCENPESCDLFVKEQSCLHCSAMQPCKFGRKVGVDGPTRASRSYFSTIDKWRKENAAFFGLLKDLKAYNRVFRTHGHFYLPYSFMTGTSGDGYPLESKWVVEGDLNAALLEKICMARPRAMMGGEISNYQQNEVPKFISDLNMHYPEIFALLPEEQKARLATVSYVGRKAELVTCAPGVYVFSQSHWTWDGEFLIGKSMLFQPVAGEIEIKIKPKAGAMVDISKNEQVLPTTRFLD